MNLPYPQTSIIVASTFRKYSHQTIIVTTGRRVVESISFAYIEYLLFISSYCRLQIYAPDTNVFQFCFLFIRIIHIFNNVN